LEQIVEPELKLQRLVTDRIWEQIEVDHLESDPRVTEPSSEYFENPLKFALDIYNYFKCYRCRMPYYGGRRECDAGAAPNADAPRAREYVCPPCLTSVNIHSCKIPEHQDSLVWKCQYCCSPAVWFCGGTTHYCDPCMSNDLFFITDMLVLHV
jgi:E3 ubiquitin-protein ligase MYCBP2